MQRRSGNAGKLFYLSRPGISDRKYDRVFPSGQGTNHKSMLRVLSIIIIALLLLVAFQQNKVEQNYNLLHSKTQLVNDLQSRYDDLSKIVTEQNKSKVSLENQLKLAKEKVKMSQKEMKHRIPTKKSTVRAKKDSKMVLVPIADGSEEIETAVITDVLKRFGAEVFIASVKKDDDLICEMSLGMKIQADISIQEAATIKFDLIALPGGMPGATFLRDSKALKEILQQQAKEKKLIGAICASPSIVLKTHGLLGGGATGYPGNGFPLENRSDAKVVVTDNIITSQGPGTTLLFALKLGEELFGKKIAAGVAKDLLIS